MARVAMWQLALMQQTTAAGRFRCRTRIAFFLDYARMLEQPEVGRLIVVDESGDMPLRFSSKGDLEPGL